MADFAQGAILIGQTLLLVLLLLVIYISIRNGRNVADRQLDILEQALNGRAAILHDDRIIHPAVQPDLSEDARGLLVDAITGVHKGMASRTRLLLAVGIFSLAAMMALSLAFGGLEDGIADTLGQGVTLLFGLLATIVGFYFGGRSAMHASSAVKGVAGKADVLVDEIRGQLPIPDAVITQQVQAELQRLAKDNPQLAKVLGKIT